jgi:hypothetical protein
LLEQGAAQCQLRSADLVQVIHPVAEQLERPPGLGLRLGEPAGPQVHLGERAHRLARIDLAAGLVRHGERTLEQADGPVGVPERVVQAAEVVQQPADVSSVGELLVQPSGALGVGAREDEMALPFGDERCLEVRVRGRLLVAGSLGELERALDVFAGSLPVALAPVAAGAPTEDVCAQAVRGQTGLLGELERRTEQPDSGGDAGQLVAGDAEPEEDGGAVDVGEPRCLGELPCAGEELERLVVPTDLDQRPRLAEQ